jgi:hypothetical protein
VQRNDSLFTIGTSRLLIIGILLVVWENGYNKKSSCALDWVINQWCWCVCTGEFLLEDVKSYKYLTQGNINVPGLDDPDLYRQLIQAMEIMGISKEEQACK